MKALPFFLVPIIVLLIACYICEAAWYYYVIAFFVGDVFGILALLGWFVIKNDKD